MCIVLADGCESALHILECGIKRGLFTIASVVVVGWELRRTGPWAFLSERIALRCVTSACGLFQTESNQGSQDSGRNVDLPSSPKASNVFFIEVLLQEGSCHHR